MKRIFDPTTGTYREALSSQSVEKRPTKSEFEKFCTAVFGFAWGGGILLSGLLLLGTLAHKFDFTMRWGVTLLLIPALSIGLVFAAMGCLSWCFKEDDSVPLYLFFVCMIPWFIAVPFVLNHSSLCFEVLTQLFQ